MINHQFIAKGFEPVAEAFLANFAENTSGMDEHGAGFCAFLGDKLIVDIYGGFANRAKDIPFASNILTPIYSTTKPIAALVIALLDQEGFLDLDAPIGDIWPEFGQHGKNISIAQTMAHQAGVPGFIDPIDPSLWLDPPALAAASADLAPLWPAGTAHGYHPLTYGYIVGEIARRATGGHLGRTLGTILREDITAPLGLDFFIGTPESEHGRCAEIRKPNRPVDLGEITPAKTAAFLTKWAAPDRGGAAWRMAEIPSANGHGTARSVAALYGVFANRGKIFSEKKGSLIEVLTPETFAKWTRIMGEGQDLVLPFKTKWAAGVMANNLGHYGPNPNVFGHSGWGGSMGFGDPDIGLSASYVMNRQSHYLIGDPRPTRLIEALYGCL